MIVAAVEPLRVRLTDEQIAVNVTVVVGVIDAVRGRARVTIGPRHKPDAPATEPPIAGASGLWHILAGRRTISATHKGEPVVR